MHDVAVALDRHQLRDLDRAVVADAAEVVASEVDEHHVLGRLLLVRAQLLAEQRVLDVGRAARARPRDRAVVDAPARAAHEHLGRGAEDRRLPELQIEHVGRRVDGAKRAVDLERVGRDVELQTLREHDLKDVARGDVLLGALDGRLEVLALRVRPRLPALAAGRLRRLDDVGEARFELVDAVERALILLFEPLGAPAGEDVRDEHHLLARVVEGDERREEGEHCVVDADVVRVRVRDLLEPADRAVAHEAHGTARERRQVVDLHRDVAPRVAPHRLERRQLLAPRHAVLLDPDGARATAQHHVRVRAEERVARDLLAALDGLEQERVGLLVRHAQERGDGREQVGHHALDDGHDRALAAQVEERLVARRRDTCVSLLSEKVVHVSPPAPWRRTSDPRVFPRDRPARGRCLGDRARARP